MSNILLDTPPRLLVNDDPETPGPKRAQINHLTKSNYDLTTRLQQAERRRKSETSSLERTISEQKEELLKTQATLTSLQATLQITQKDLAKFQEEANGLREEMSLFAAVQQHKLLLALAQEEMRSVELEQKLVQAETARVIREHKMALLKAKDDDLSAEMTEKDVKLKEITAELKNARNSSSASDKEIQKELKAAQSEKKVLESKLEKLESTVQSLKTKEKETRTELDALLKDEKGKESGADKEKRDLQIQLRAAKKDVDKKTEEVSDLQEELASLKETSKSREEALKTKIRVLREEQEKIVGLEDEGECSRPPAKISAPAKKPKAATRAASEDVESDNGVKTKAVGKKSVKEKPRARETSPVEEEEVPRKQAKKAKEAESSEEDEPPKKAKAKAKEVLGERADDNGKAPIAKRKTVASPAKAGKADKAQEEVPEPAADGGVKKKKRTLLKVQSTFAWDSVMNSADGVIPSTLSPMRGTGARIGTIPRSGLSGLPSSRSLSRF